MVNAAHRGLIVLDRDGVINHDSPDFVKSAEEWRPIDGSIRAIADLSSAGFDIAVASNQSGLARDLFDADALDSMHDKLYRLVAAQGGRVDHIIVCPHGPEDGCTCRKPKPGMLRELGALFGVSLERLPVVGDSLRDIQAAAAVGARPILVRTGNGTKTEADLPTELATIEVFDDLAAVAAALIDD